MLSEGRRVFLAMTFCLAAMAGGPSFAQEGRTGNRPGLITPDEGAAIVETAFQSVRFPRYKPDCSHLVHDIYQRVGFDYEFANSHDLYVGIDRFQRVLQPQPGDLIVWRGHVGIVVDPSAHTFYSSLRGGLMTDYYDAPHWLRRGKPRFYRYRPDGERELRQLARMREIPNAEISERARDTGSNQKNVLRSKPSQDDLQRILMEHMNAEAEKLLLQDSLDLAKNVTVVDRVEIEKLKMKKDAGWAVLRIEHAVSLIDGQMIGRRLAKHRITLRRNGQHWIVENPQTSVYLPRAVATRVFAHYLSLLARNSGDQQAMRTTMKVLDTLLNGAEPVAVRHLQESAEVSPR